MNCAVCHQAASSGHGAKSEAVGASPEPAGDLQPPPRERPELLSGGEKAFTYHPFQFFVGLAIDSAKCSLARLVVYIGAQDNIKKTALQWSADFCHLDTDSS